MNTSDVAIFPRLKKGDIAEAGPRGSARWRKVSELATLCPTGQAQRGLFQVVPANWRLSLPFVLVAQSRDRASGNAGGDMRATHGIKPMVHGTGEFGGARAQTGFFCLLGSGCAEYGPRKTPAFSGKAAEKIFLEQPSVKCL